MENPEEEVTMEHLESLDLEALRRQLSLDPVIEVFQTDGLSLGDLPDECLIPILKKVPLENMDDMSLVSLRFDKVIQENIGLEIWASDVGFRLSGRIFNDLPDVAKYTITSLKSRVIDEPFPTLKIPEGLLDLELAAPTKILNFRTMTHETVNLAELTLEYGSLTLENLSSVPLDLPSLRTLSVKDRAFESKGPAVQEIIAGNILGLLSKRFPSIRALELSAVATRKLTEEYGIQLLKFLQMNAESIKELKVNIATALRRETRTDYGSLDHVSVLNDDTSGQLDWKQLSQIRFEWLDIEFGLRYFVGMEEWRRLLGNQDSLVNLNFSLGKPLPPTVTLPSINLSASSLVSIQLGLEINRRDEPTFPIDCTILESCVNLKVLNLTGNTVDDENRDRSKECFNTDKLPKSIENVSISNMLILESDLESLFLALPDLKKVSLEKVGVEGAFGMTLPLLSKVLDHRQLPEIIVKGINGDECQFCFYEHLGNLGLRLPFKTATFHVTYFAHYMEYMYAGEC